MRDNGKGFQLVKKKENSFQKKKKRKKEEEISYIYPVSNFSLTFSIGLNKRDNNTKYAKVNKIK